jgi:hypothetical protein
VEEKIFDIVIGASAESEAEHINTIQKRRAMARTAMETKPKTSPARRQLDRAIVDGEANLVVPGG